MKKTITVVSACLLAALTAGCAVRYSQESVDRDVYRVIREKELEALGTETEFSLDYRDYQAGTAEAPGEEPLVLSLARALELAARHNRDYQRQKEDLYLRALTLTGERYLYGPRFTGAGADAGVSRSAGENAFSAGLNISFLQWLADRARITLDFSADFLRYLSGDPRKGLDAVLGANLLQPLFRGSERRVEKENLAQAERNVVYQIRTFIRYQRSFSVETASSWFRLLEQKMILANRENNYQRLVENRGRAEMMGEAGRMELLQVDQARQNELAAENSLVDSRARYREALDRFKIQLGLPISFDIELRAEDLDRYLADELPRPGIVLEEAITVALDRRMDLVSEADAVADAERKAALVKDNLRARLDLSGRVTRSQAITGDGGNSDSYSAGLNLELPVDRVSPRNAYRQSLITLERSRRNYQLRLDTVALQVRTAWSTLEQARQSHEIEKISLGLAQQRVDSVNMLLEAGRASQRDILEAQAALLSAQNGMVSSMITYYIAYLEFLRDIEQLPLGESGVWTGGFDDGQEI